MHLHNLENRSRGGYTAFGSIWSKGEQSERDFVILNEAGERIPVQSRVLAWWPDGSVKWMSHTADSDQMGSSVRLLPSVDNLNLQGIEIHEREQCFLVNTGVLTLELPKAPSGDLARNVRLKGKLLAERIYPVFQMEHRNYAAESYRTNIREYCGLADAVVLEETGPLQAVFCIHGRHVNAGEAAMPFVIRIYFGYNSAEIRIEHTFLFDGEEQRDFLKGMGIRLDTVLGGNPCDKQIKLLAEDLVFHEAAVMLESRIPRVTAEVLQEQLTLGRYDYEEGSKAAKAAADLPVWDRYVLHQDSHEHFVIRKQTKPECCKIDCRHGKRAPGAMAVSGRNGGVLVGMADFWQKYPSGLEVNGLGKEHSRCTAWFYCPEAEAFDFRHYDTRSYPYSSYEGFEEFGASAYGIGVSSECTIHFMDRFPDDHTVQAFGARMQKPPAYIGDPEYYYQKHAFGYWSLPSYENDAERWLEQQLAAAFDFYRDEVEARSWYGLFDYGDVMHTYDRVRHCWKYDVGGYAWQNTELVPTYWLWLYFLRTGREDVFTLAKAMSKHCSEVDTYHFGKYKGLGSRHNVRHWGCPCKEPRVSMAGHHRFLYYLTADRRLGDIFDDVEDADYAMTAEIHTQIPQQDGSRRAGIRSGPDWSSFVSNWMTQYERTLDPKYRCKIETGIRDIAATPYGFASGPDYYYDVEASSLIYRGEIEDTPNQHLQICMGGPQIWWEAAEMLEDDRLNSLLTDLGAFYYLSQEEKSRLTEGRILQRPFAWPMFAAGIAAYSAMRNKDQALARQAWQILLQDLTGDALRKAAYASGSGKIYYEIPGITTNVTAQCCLNSIMCLEFIREYLPEAFKEAGNEQ